MHGARGSPRPAGGSPNGETKLSDGRTEKKRSTASYAAYEKNVAYGAALLFLCGIGAGIPVILAGTAASRLVEKLERSRWRPWVDRGVGLSLLGVGCYLLWIA